MTTPEVETPGKWGHGGRRPGAGRKPKDPNAPRFQGAARKLTDQITSLGISPRAIVGLVTSDGSRIDLPFETIPSNASPSSSSSSAAAAKAVAAALAEWERSRGSIEGNDGGGSGDEMDVDGDGDQVGESSTAAAARAANGIGDGDGDGDERVVGPDGQMKRKRGRPKGSKNTPRPGTEKVIKIKRPVGRPKGSKTKHRKIFKLHHLQNGTSHSAGGAAIPTSFPTNDTDALSLPSSDHLTSTSTQPVIQTPAREDGLTSHGRPTVITVDPALLPGGSETLNIQGIIPVVSVAPSTSTSSDPNVVLGPENTNWASRYLQAPFHPLSTPSAPNPNEPPPSSSPSRTTSNLMNLSDPKAVHTALSSALNRLEPPESITRLIGGNMVPSTVSGPFILPPASSTNSQNPTSALGDGSDNRTLTGPVDPSLLPTSHAIAVYYVVYESSTSVQPQPTSVPPPTSAAIPVSQSQPQARPERLEGEQQRARSTPGPGGSEERSPSNGTATGTGSGSGTKKKRGPRKCSVCGSYECKGRGGRKLCERVLGVGGRAGGREISITTGDNRDEGDEDGEGEEGNGDGETLNDNPALEIPAALEAGIRQIAAANSDSTSPASALGALFAQMGGGGGGADRITHDIARAVAAANTFGTGTSSNNSLSSPERPRFNFVPNLDFVPSTVRGNTSTPSPTNPNRTGTGIAAEFTSGGRPRTPTAAALGGSVGARAKRHCKKCNSDHCPGRGGVQYCRRSAGGPSTSAPSS